MSVLTVVWLHTQMFRVKFPALSDSLSIGSRTGSTQTREDKRGGTLKKK
jgi:hypothetical protein